MFLNRYVARGTILILDMWLSKYYIFLRVMLLFRSLIICENATNTLKYFWPKIMIMILIVIREIVAWKL